MGSVQRRWAALKARGGSERGSSLIGFLLVFPMVLVMSFGLFQFVLYALAVEEISTAAREGARRAALDGGTVADGDALAHQIVSGGKVLSGDIAVTGQRGPADTALTVTGQCKWLLSDDLFGGGSCHITRTAVVPTEQYIPGIVATS